ncbi:BSD-domain-containing protein [Hypoxylon sp. FL1284]|nr:BSD-domain-containing protein [Hypoxylon sp. FL1284]
MDLAYDHIAEESLPKDSERDSKEDTSPQDASSKQPEHTLNEDLQDAYRAFSSSPWGTWLGGHVGNVIKQGESVYREAQQEVTSLGADASRGFASLRARALSLRTVVPPTLDQTARQPGDKEKDAETTPTTAKAGGSDDAAKESETVMSRLRNEATKRLKDIQRAEDAADEALLKFGGNVRNFFRDAIIVKPGAESEDASARRFESKDDSGKRVIHASRYDAQLHVLHTTEKSFTEDPATAEFATWAKDFDVEKQTENISADLAKYPELRANMEKLVPSKIPYANFWVRYYFLRHSIETAEARRRDLLKAASAEEEIGWGEESSDEESEEDSEDEKAPAKSAEKVKRPASTESSTTIHPPAAAAAAATSDKTRLKASEPRKSNDEKSQADSDTSYDLVGAASGNQSQAPSSPKDSRKAEDSDDDSEEDSDEDSDDEEWE